LFSSVYNITQYNYRYIISSKYYFQSLNRSWNNAFSDCYWNKTSLKWCLCTTTTILNLVVYNHINNIGISWIPDNLKCIRVRKRKTYLFCWSLFIEADYLKRSFKWIIIIHLLSKTRTKQFYSVVYINITYLTMCIIFSSIHKHTRMLFRLRYYIITGYIYIYQFSTFHICILDDNAYFIFVLSVYHTVF